MFTGIIRQVGVVKRAAASAAGRRLRIDLGPMAAEVRGGDSVAVNGACLTVAALDGAEAEFDVIGQTLSQTTLGALAAGAKVNLERSLRVSDGLDGHLVQGHVDGVAEVKAVRRGAARHVVEFAAPRLVAQMAPQGSVAIDGVSLTLVDAGAQTFSVALIPTTLQETTLAALAVGSKVNVEIDLIAKYVRRCIEQLLPEGGGLTLQKLKDAGFA